MLYPDRRDVEELILGLGNTLNGDDGIGSYVAERISEQLRDAEEEPAQAKSAGSGRLIAIDCGTAPENYTSIIRKRKPDRLILVDAADMGLEPGSYRTISPERIGVMHVSTHNIPLSILISYVSQFCRDVVLIGIQPHRMDFGPALSPVVKNGGDHVANLIMEKRLNEIRPLEP